MREVGLACWRGRVGALYLGVVVGGGGESWVWRVVTEFEFWVFSYLGLRFEELLGVVFWV